MGRAVSAAGDHVRAHQLAVHAERIALSVTAESDWQAYWSTLVAVSGAFAAVRDFEHAEEIVHVIHNDFYQLDAATDVAEEAIAAGDFDRAAEIARTYRGMGLATTVGEKLAAAGSVEKAEEIAKSFSGPRGMESPLIEVAEAWAVAGDIDRATGVARSISGPDGRALALAAVAKGLAAGGKHIRARQLATEAAETIRSMPDLNDQTKALVAVATLIAAAGYVPLAEEIVQLILHIEERTQALVELAKVVELPIAGRLLGQALALGPWLTSLPLLAQLYPNVICRVADDMYSDEALSVSMESFRM